MAEPPLVSIVTPSLNQARYLGDAIRSVRDQDYPRIEHIVVDGASTDATLEVLAGYAHLRWLSEPDAGQAEAINKGFALAQGQIFAWLNADDAYLPGAVSAAVEALRGGYSLVYGSWRQIDEEGRVLKEVGVRPWDYGMLLERANFVAQPTAFFTREAFESVGGVDPRLRYALDHDLWLKIGARYPVKPLDRPLASFRLHPESKSVAESDRFAREVVRVSRRHGGRRLSPYYLDYYLPRERPAVYRAVVAARMLRRGELRPLAGLARTAVAKRLGRRR